jgi:hypothetical protein
LATASTLVAALLLPLEAASATVSTELFVSPSGAGTACSQASPCTLGQAQLNVRNLIPAAAGDIAVNLADGTYSLAAPLSFGTADSGRDASHRVIWRAASGAVPVLSGAASVTGWVQAGTVGGKQIWRAPAPAGVTGTRELFINGRRAVRARSDYQPNFTLTSQNLAGQALGPGIGAFTTPHTAGSISSWSDPTAVEVVFHSTFITNRCTVGSVDSNTTSDLMTIADPCWYHAEWSGDFAAHAQVVNYLENAYELMDSPGEWYFDAANVVGNGANTVYYVPRAGETMTGSGSVQVTVPRLTSLITVAGSDSGGTISRVHDLVFDGLTFADSTYELPTLKGMAGVADDSASSITYSGSWQAQTTATGQYRRTQHFTQTNNDSFTGTFNGTGVTFVSSLNTDRGTFDYSIDNGPAQQGTCYSTALVYQKPCLTVTGLSSGQHTIKVTKTGGTYLSVDVLRAVNPPNPDTVPAYVVEQSDVIVTGDAEQCDLSDHVATAAAVTIARAADIEFTRNTITRVGETALLVEKSSNNIQITGNHVYDASANGIHIGGVSMQDQRPTNNADRMHDISVSNNYVHDIGVEFNSAVGIVAGFVDTLTISHNEVGNVPYSGISVGWGWGFMGQGGYTYSNGTYCPSKAELDTHTTEVISENTTVSQNFVHDYMRIGMDGGGVYTLGNQPNSTISGNYFAHTGNYNSHQFGVYLDNGTHGYTVSNNVIEDVTVPTLLNYASGIIASSGNVDGGGNVSSSTSPAGQAIVADAGLAPAYRYLNPQSDLSNLAQGATATATASKPSQTPDRAIDQLAQTRWETPDATNDATLTVTFPQTTRINRVVTHESLYLGTGRYGHINSYTVEYQNPAGTWINVASGSYPTVAQTDAFAPVDASAVRLRILTTGAAGIDKFGVYLDDLALGRSATQSSTAFGGVASRAVDGSTNGAYNAGSVTSTDNDANAWWQVDLGETYSLTSINLFNRTDLVPERLSDYWVFVSDTPFNTTLTPAQQAAVSGVWSQHITTQAGSPTKLATTATGRYVMVQLNGTNYLALAEVQVLGARPAAPNIAAGTTATQSSTAFSGAASRAVDGSTDGNFYNGSVSHTGNDTNAWWSTDLGDSYSLSAVNVFNRTDLVPERLSDYWVFVSDTPFNTSLTPAQQAAVSGVWSQHLTTQAGSPTRIATPATGRYVMVQLNDTNYLSLAEVQVFGTTA